MSQTLHLREATAADVPELARLNKQLIEDEGHRNPVGVPELESCIQFWQKSGFDDYALTLERG